MARPVRTVIQHIAVPSDRSAALEIFHAIEVDRCIDRHLFVQAAAEQGMIKARFGQDERIEDRVGAQHDQIAARRLLCPVLAVDHTGRRPARGFVPAAKCDRARCAALVRVTRTAVPLCRTLARSTGRCSSRRRIAAIRGHTNATARNYLELFVSKSTTADGDRTECCHAPGPRSDAFHFFKLSGTSL